MMRGNQITTLFVALFVSSTIGIEVKEKCSEFVAVEESPGIEPLTSLSLGPFLSQLPVDLFFDQPVRAIDVINNSVAVSMTSPKEWRLNLLRNRSLTPDEEILMEVIAEDAPASVEKIQVGGDVICGQRVPLPKSCKPLTSEFVYEKDDVLRVASAWATGANYELNIASHPDYVGYRVDVFFEKPVTAFNVFNPSVKEFEITPLHWVLMNQWTDPACQKLVQFRFGLSFDNLANFTSLYLNGKKIFGIDVPLEMLTENDINDKAITEDCETFLTRHSGPWFGGEKARSLWVATTFKPRLKAGLVVDFVFEEPLKELRTWHFNVQNVSGEHWRVYNPGWYLTPETYFRFNAIFAFNKHYHVKFKGIQVNGQILCGLAAQESLLIDHRHISAVDKVEQQVSSLGFFSILITVSLAMVAINVIISVIIFFFILVVKLAETQDKDLLPFYASTTTTTTDQTYATINKGLTNEEGEYVSHM